MSEVKEVVDLVAIEQKMLEEIRKWREQRAAMEKAYDEAFHMFVKKK